VRKRPQPTSVGSSYKSTYFNTASRSCRSQHELTRNNPPQSASNHSRDTHLQKHNVHDRSRISGETRRSHSHSIDCVFPSTPRGPSAVPSFPMHTNNRLSAYLHHAAQPPTSKHAYTGYRTAQLTLSLLQNERRHSAAVACAHHTASSIPRNRPRWDRVRPACCYLSIGGACDVKCSPPNQIDCVSLDGRG
jgi:hypothetical protein